jgi:hypothetical protein
MMPAIRNWTRDEMMKRVAFFRDLAACLVGRQVLPANIRLFAR